MATPSNTIKQVKSMLPTHEQAFEWPRQAMRERKWSEAAARWAILREAYPKHPAPWIQAASAHMEAMELDQAEELLDQAREKFPNNPNTLTKSAELTMHQNKWDAAEKFLKEARKKFPDNLQAWLQSANCAEKQGDQYLANTYNEIARQLEPDSPAPFIQHAEQAMRAKQWAEALERWALVRSHFPNVSAAYLQAAEAARCLKRSKEARKLLQAHKYGNDIFNSSENKHETSIHTKNSKNLRRFLELIWTKAIFNMRSEMQRNYLSYSWLILEPMIHMVVYYVVFGVLLQRGGENYAVFLLTGLIPWMWFSKAISGSSNSIIAGQNLMLQIGLPSIIFPLISILQATLKQLPVFILLLIFIWLQGFPPTNIWYALILVLLVQSLLVITFACTIAAIIPFMRDLSYLVPTGLTFLMFLSGIFYDYRIISEEWQSVFLLNPVAFLLKSYREILIEGISPDLLILTWWGVASFITCILLIIAFQRLRYVYPRIVLE